MIEGDGTRGFAAGAPYEAILVAAAGRTVPKSLLEQLTIGGRLIIPVGATLQPQRLLRITRVAADEYREDDLGEVIFVPLIDEDGCEGRTARCLPIPAIPSASVG